MKALEDAQTLLKELASAAMFYSSCKCCALLPSSHVWMDFAGTPWTWMILRCFHVYFVSGI